MRPLVSALESLSGEELLLPVNLASRLVLSSTSFAQQFVQVWAGVEGDQCCCFVLCVRGPLSAFQASQPCHALPCVISYSHLIAVRGTRPVMYSEAVG